MKFMVDLSHWGFRLLQILQTPSHQPGHTEVLLIMLNGPTRNINNSIAIINSNQSSHMRKLDVALHVPMENLKYKERYLHDF